MKTLNDNKRQRIAIPILNSRPSSSFCIASSFLFVDIEGKHIEHLDFVVVPPKKSEFWPEWFSEMGITDVIVQNIRQNTKKMLMQQDIKIVEHAEKNDTIDAVYNSLIETGKASRYGLFDTGDGASENHLLSYIDDHIDISEFNSN